MIVDLLQKFGGVMTFGPEFIDSSSLFKIKQSLFNDISFLFVFFNCCVVEHCRIHFSDDEKNNRSVCNLVEKLSVCIYLNKS